MKYYIEKTNGVITGKGCIDTTNEIVLSEGQELVTKELYDSITFPEPEPIPQPPTPEEQIEQLRLEQAQSNAELFEMMLMLTGAVV